MSRGVRPDLLRRVGQLEAAGLSSAMLNTAEQRYRRTGQIPSNPKVADHLLRMEAAMVLITVNTSGQAHCEAAGQPWPPNDWEEHQRRSEYQALAKQQVLARRNRYLVHLVSEPWPPLGWPKDLDPWPSLESVLQDDFDEDALVT